MRIRSLLLAAGLAAGAMAAAAAGAGAVEIDRSGNAAGRPLVFVPGLASPAALWTPWAGKFGRSYDVHVVGIGGFAGLPPSGALTLTGIAGELATYFDELALHDAVVVGQSAGGMVAMQTANLSDRVGALVLIDSVPFTAALLMPGATPGNAAPMAAGFGEAMRSMPLETFRQQQRAGLGRYTLTESFMPTLIEWSDSSDRDAVVDIYTDLLSTDYREGLAGVDVPIHVLAAWHASMGVPRDAVAELFEGQYEAHADTTVEVIEDTLHFIMVDRPDAFEASLRRALGEAR